MLHIYLSNTSSEKSAANIITIKQLASHVKVLDLGREDA